MYRGELRQLLQRYEDEKIKPLHLRLLEGIKAKHLVRFEQRKLKLKLEKERKRYGEKEQNHLKRSKSIPRAL